MPRTSQHRVLLPVLSAVLLLALAACGRQEPQPAAGAAVNAPYATLTLTARPLAHERLVDGRVEAVEQGTVSAQTQGQVLAVVRDAGEQVAAGEPVLRIRPVMQQAQFNQADAAWRAARARAVEAQARYQRVAGLFARDVVAKATMDEVTAARDATVAARDAAAAARAAASEHLAYTVVRMPFAGAITDRFVHVGESVGPGTPLFAAASLARLRVITDISQELAAAIRQQPRANVYVGDVTVQVERVVIYPRAADTAATVRVRLDLFSATQPGVMQSLLPGSFVKAGFVLGEKSALLVPRAALVERGEVMGVYVFDPKPPGRTVLRQVRVGASRGEQVEVLSGLVAGEQIAADPSAALRHLRP